jgi:hypothetical protein
MKSTNSVDLREFMGWHCASCDQLISDADAGWVEWLASEDACGNTVLSGLRLVHRTVSDIGASRYGCRYDVRQVFRDHGSIVEGLTLETFLGADGLMVLLSFLAAGQPPKAEVIELAKRVQVPGYELTCNLLRKGKISKALIPFFGHDCYLQSEMQEILIGAEISW